MKKIILALAILVASLTTSGVLLPQETYAAPCEQPGSHILGLRAWYDGIATGDPCTVPSDAFKGEDNIRKNVWLIVLNIASSILGVVGYLAICFVIWGGYQYILARGDPGKVVRGKKTIVNALIGLVVCVLASTISGMIADIVNEGRASGNIFTAAMNHAFTWASIICVIVIVIGGIQYTISNGNPAGVQKAKQTIMYAAIGLAISLLAVAIVNFVVGAL